VLIKPLATANIYKSAYNINVEAIVRVWVCQQQSDGAEHSRQIERRSPATLATCVVVSVDAPGPWHSAKRYNVAPLVAFSKCRGKFGHHYQYLDDKPE
jgi:hypothetical protein